MMRPVRAPIRSRLAVLLLASASVQLLAATLGPTAPLLADDSVKLSGYLDFRKASFLIVDAQRVEVNKKTKFHGSGKVKRPEQIPLGYEIKVKGTRRTDGVVVARELDAKPNGIASFEEDVLKGTNQAEQSYLKEQKVYQAGTDGNRQVVGALHASGPQVDRCRGIVDRLLPPYVDPKSVRVYVVDNKEWNAMAMANYSIYVFSGLMADMDDDELAIVLGHELAHATNEHSRRQAAQNNYAQLAGLAASLGAGLLKSDLGKSAVQGASALGVVTFGNAFSRDYEDQADRVGLRFVYEAGYDYTKAPKLWHRFAEKYGDSSKVENFFFGNHSLSEERAHDLQREIARNYRNPAADPPVKSFK